MPQTMEEEDDNPPVTSITTTFTKTQHFLLSFSFLLSLISTFSISFANDTEVMFKISQSFTIPPPGWSDPDPCKWVGVRCDSSMAVTSIDLKSKFLSGTLPPDLNQLSNLIDLSLQYNRLTGSLPPLYNLSNLREVYLDGNGFTSVPSHFLANLTSLHVISLNNNPLVPWVLPYDSFKTLISLQSFQAINASIYGQLPDVFGSLPTLQELRVSYNNLTGPLPRSFGGSAIQTLLINDQKTGMSGTLDVLGEMQSLVKAWVHNNHFVGTIPDVSKCTELADLQLRGNWLTGLVPNSLINLPKLQNVSLQDNILQGPMPAFKIGVAATLAPANSFCTSLPGGPCDPQVMALIAIAGALGYPMELAESWKGNDACIRWPHVTCDSSGKTLSGVNLAKQGFKGTISPDFANLTSLTTIVLSDNHLYGRIPQSLSSLKQLRHLDLSNNNLTGKVPAFSQSVKVNVHGNKFIGTNVDTTPGLSSGGSEKSYSFSGIVIVVLIILVALSILIYSVVMKKGKMKFSMGKHLGNKGLKQKQTSSGSRNQNRDSTKSRESSGLVSIDGGGVVYTIEEIQEATNNFSGNNILGKGGFGVVYRGLLSDGSTQLAVKRMESFSLGGTKGLSEFESEITVLSKVRHRHLVALLGYCVTENERLVVYEYMAEGTLAQHLFEWKKLGRSPLTWKQRLVIALDVARGVEYLHTMAHQSFIHRDLKPSNILLGSDMRAKVSDFGLVKHASDAAVETRLAGTFGYLAPEYAATGRVTTKIDVFAFGVVLMEMITGRKALDESYPEDMVQLVTWFRKVIKSPGSDIGKHIDAAIDRNQETLDSIQKVAELAGHCTAREPNQRADMSHAVNILSPLVQQWKPTLTSTSINENSIDIDVPSLSEAMKKWQSGEDSMISDYDRTVSNVHSTAATTPSLSKNVEGR